MPRWVGISVVALFILAAFSQDTAATMFQVGVVIAAAGFILGLISRPLFWLFPAGIGVMLLPGLADLWRVPISLALMVGVVCLAIFLLVTRPRPRARRH
ncbi:MAG: hypothetical protein WD603_00905 [Patescibacteria group bacterium]